MYYVLRVKEECLHDASGGCSKLAAPMLLTRRRRHPVPQAGVAAAVSGLYASHVGDAVGQQLQAVRHRRQP